MARGKRHTTELGAGGVRPADLFKGDVQYRAPVFQRHYVWKQKQFDLLWTDLSLLREEGGEVDSRFLGALVLEDQGGGLATDPDEYLIVDGQQRLLTIYLALIAIAERAHGTGDPAGETFARDIARQHLVNQGSRVRDEAKVIPTLEDFSQFRSVMQALSNFASPALPAPYGPLAGYLTTMFERIRARLDTEIEGIRSAVLAGGDATPQVAAAAEVTHLEALASTILNNLQFVEIVLGDDDDPHHVFDRLNDAGIKLDVADLVRNDVFQRMSGDPAGAQKLHMNAWAPLEASLKGALGQFTFPYALIKKSGTTKGRMMSDLRAEWQGQAAKDVIDDLNAYVPAFMAVSSEAPVRKPSSVTAGFWAQVRRLASMPIPSSAYPYTMMVVREAVEGRLDQGDAESDLLLVESFLVRRALAGYEPTGLHSLFKTMWQRSKGDPAGLLTEIDSRPTIQFPDNKVFEDHIRTRPLYGRRLAGYVLSEFDRKLPGDPTPDIRPTIDHVMPRKPSAAWSVAPAEHALLLHTWANLVPLSGPGNSSKGNEPWPKVQKRLLAESSFKTPRDLALRYSSWGPAEIRQRADEVVAWALKRWPRH